MAEIETIRIHLSNYVEVAVRQLQKEEWEYEFLGNLSEKDEDADWISGTIEGTFDELLEFIKKKAADMD